MSKLSDDVHIHHYVVGMIVVSFACYQNILITVCHGIFNGIMVEGVSRWGYDPTFINHKKEEEF